MKRFLLFFLLLFATTALFADQKVKKRMSFGQQAFDSTSYIKGQRSRDEMNMGGMAFVTIHQCDTGKIITLNDRTRTYMVTTEQQPSEAPRKPATAAKPGAAPKPGPEEQESPSTPGRKGGVVTISTSVQDTGERKDFFGFKARHVKTAMDMEASPDSCNPGSFKMSTDGWYVDFEEGVKTCIRPERQMMEGPSSPMSSRRSKPDCQDRIKYSGLGFLAVTKLGYPVDVTTTFHDKEGKEQSMRQQALEISKATLDAGLFEPPAGYREVKSYAEMMGMGNLGDMMRSMGRAQQQPSAAAAASAGESVSAASSGAAPKEAGKLRVGVAALQDKSGHAGFDGNALRAQLISSVQRFGYDVVAADGPDDNTVMADARQKDCDYVLFTDVAAKEVSQKRKAAGLFGKAIAIGTMGPMGAAVPTGGAFEASVAYRLFKIDGSSPELEGKSDVKGKPEESIPGSFDHESRDVATQIQKDVMAKQ